MTAKVFRAVLLIAVCVFVLGAFNNSLVTGLLGFVLLLMAVTLRSRTIVNKGAEGD